MRTRAVYAIPLRSPRIDEIRREPAFPGYPVRQAVAASGDTIVLLGTNLRGDATRVVIGTEVVLAPAAQARRIEVVVPSALPAGLHAVHVVHDLLLDAAPGDPPVPPNVCFARKRQRRHRGAVVVSYRCRGCRRNCFGRAGGRLNWWAV